MAQSSSTLKGTQEAGFSLLELLALTLMSGLLLKEALDLFPLHAYGEVFQIEKNRSVGKGEEAIHIFARREKPNGVGYTVLGSRETHSRGKQAWEERFADIFKIEAWQYQWQTKSALAKYAFSQRMDELLELFIGRDEHVAAAARRIEATESEILWLGGKPGMGKSTFMAKLIRETFQHETEATIIIPYFFQLSDGEMCRTTSFLEAAILRLARATEQHIRPKDDLQERLVQFKTLLNDSAQQGGKKLLFFVDGLDEIAGVDEKFVDLIFDCHHPGVVWVRAGRDEEMLQQRFSRQFPSSLGVQNLDFAVGGSEAEPTKEEGEIKDFAVKSRFDTPSHEVGWFFECNSEYEALRVTRPEDEGLLPPLTAENVRGFLIEQLGHQLKVLFERDQQHSDGSWSNTFIEELVRRSEGLPLYLNAVDLRA